MKWQNIINSRLLKCFKHWTGSKSVIAGVLLSSLMINLLGLVFPLFLLQIYDRIIGNNAVETLSVLTFIVVGAIGLEWVLKICRTVVTSWLDTQFEYRMGIQAFESLVKTSWENFAKSGTGNYLEKLSALYSMRDFFGGQALTAIVDLPFILIYLSIIAYVGGYLVLAPLLVLGLFLISAGFIGNKVKDTLQESKIYDERRVNFVLETLSNISTVKTTAMEAQMNQRYERLQKNMAAYDYKIGQQTAMASSIAGVLSQLNLVLIVSVGALGVINHDLTIGALAACTMLGNRMLQPIGKLMQLWRRLQSIVIAQDKLESIISLPPEQAECSKTEINGDIEFKNVSLKHDKNNKYLFKNINFTIKQGETIAITGDGLCGKSTLLNMIMGFIKPNNGQVLIDGKPLSEHNIFELRKDIAYLPQRGELFKGTILENIVLFRGAKYIDKGLELAEELGVDGPINQLPEGFSTVVGNSTIDYLPDGIKQRITIARELVIDPKIILFDEANTAVDIAADEKIRQYLQKIKGKHTLILISHRPSIVKLADRTFDIDNGQLQEVDDERSRKFL